MNIDLTLVPQEDLVVLVKAAYWLVEKGEPLHAPHGGHVHRVSVPVREFERVRSKVRKVVVI